MTEALARWLRDENYSLDQAMDDGMTEDEYCEVTDITPEQWERYKNPVKLRFPGFPEINGSGPVIEAKEA